MGMFSEAAANFTKETSGDDKPKSQSAPAAAAAPAAPKSGFGLAPGVGGQPDDFGGE